MKKYITAFQMTQSMFCALPVPCKAWDEKCRPYMLIFLPVIGLEIGILWFLAHWVFHGLKLPLPIYGLAMCALPYVTTGFMHLDGYMDVTDAIGSWRDLEKRRAILKDSHVGSFAVVWSTFLILAGFAAFSTMKEDTNPYMLLLIPVISRCCSALAVMNLKPMHTSQYAGADRYPKWHSILLIMAVLACIAGTFLVWNGWVIVLLAEVIAYGLALRKAYGLLEGMNGDISGYSICICEAVAVITLALI